MKYSSSPLLLPVLSQLKSRDTALRERESSLEIVLVDSARFLMRTRPGKGYGLNSIYTPWSWSKLLANFEIGCWAMADSLLVIVPHKRLHGKVNIVVQ